MSEPNLRTTSVTDTCKKTDQAVKKARDAMSVQIIRWKRCSFTRWLCIMIGPSK
jgi:hypothetical protein